MSIRQSLFAAATAIVALVAPPGAAHAEAAGNAALGQDYTPSPALWRLADADTTIYLFGTFHLLPEGFQWRTEQFDAIVREVDSLVLESSDADAEASLTELGTKMIRAASRTTSIYERLSPQVREYWRLMIEESGQPFEVVDAMPIAMAILGFGASPEDAGISSYEYGVETVLQREFAESGRPVSSIEDHASVMLSLMRIPDEALIRELEAELAFWSYKDMAGSPQAPLPEGDPLAMEHAWARGELEEDFDVGLGQGKIGNAINRVLLTRRNAAWALWLEDRLEQPGTILVAVGAGHFEGRNNLRDFAARRGMTIERIG